MQSKLLTSDWEKTWAIVFDKGDEFISVLTSFARSQRLVSAHFVAIGAFQSAVLGYFDREEKEYLKIPIGQQVEVLTLAGDIARTEGGEPKVHAHAVLGRSDGTTRGGHVLEARVWPTLEVMLTENAGEMVRRSDPETGLALIRL